VSVERDEWMRRLGPLYPAAVAIRRTTVARVPARLGVVGEDLPRSAPWVVGLGALTGFLAYVAAWLIARWGGSPLLAAAVAVAMLAVAGGAVAEAGFARWAEQRAGRAAVIGSAASLVVRFAALASIAPGHWLAALVVAELAARWSALLLQRLGDPILDDAERPGLSVGEVSWGVVGAVTLAVVIAAGWGFGGRGVAAVVACGVAAFGLGLEAQRRDGQPTSDALAAAASVGGAIVLVAVAIIAPAWPAWHP
jgi:adenosylcobinamide-GDP ribazoletransferase